MIADIDAKIYVALSSYLATMPGGYAIIEPGEVYPSDATIPFVVVTDARFGNTRRYIGSTADDVHGGVLSLSIMAPLSWTHTQLLGIAGVINSHFSKDLILDNLVEIGKTPDAGVAYRDGGYNRLPVNITWRAVG